jgi:probable rRNA maturation factor
MQELNRHYRNKDKPTDVLSFPFTDGKKYEINPESGRIVLGDIVISVETALRQAEMYSHSPGREIAFLTVHGMLHLLGYDHEQSQRDETVMFKKQNFILERIGL